MFLLSLIRLNKGYSKILERVQKNKKNKILASHNE